MKQNLERQDGKQNSNIQNSGFQFALVWMVLFIFFLSLNILNTRYNLGTVEKVYETILWVTMPIFAYLIRERKQESKQFLVIVLFFAAIWGLGIINPNVRKWNHMMILLGGLGQLSSCVILLFSIFKSNKKSVSSPHKNKTNDNAEQSQTITSVKKYLPVCCIAILFFILSFETFSESPHLDSTMYYTKFNKLSTYFDYSFSNIFTDFCFFKHVSIGYALFVLLGEEIQSYTTLGVHIVNFLIALVSGFSFFELLDYLYPNRKMIMKYIGMAMYLLSPFVLGTLGYFNIDFPAVYFFVIMISCFIRDRRILAFSAAYAFVFSKEPCVVYYCFFLLGVWICQWMGLSQKSIGKFLASIWDFIRNYIYELLIVIIWLASYLFLGSSSWVGGVHVDMDASPEKMRRFGFTWDNFVAKMEQIFVLNFNWLFVILIATALVLVIIAQKKQKHVAASVIDKNLSKNDSTENNLLSVNEQAQKLYHFCLIFSLVGILLFNFLFIDLPNPRYIAVASVIVLLLGIESITVITEKMEGKYPRMTKVGYIPASVIALIIIIQSMVSIDPVSYLVLDPVPYYGKNMFVSGYKVCAICERTIYNREYNYFDRAVVKILDEVDYRQGDLVFFEGHFPNPYGYQPMVAWNQKTRQLSTVENENTVLIDLDRVEIPAEKNPKRIIHILEVDQDAGDNECQMVRYRSMAVKYYVQDVD